MTIASIAKAVRCAFCETQSEQTPHCLPAQMTVDQPALRLRKMSRGDEIAPIPDHIWQSIPDFASLHPGCRLRAPYRPKRTAGEPGHHRCPNSDIENLELGHRQVSNSHRMLTRKCEAFDPPIDASGLDWGFVPRWSPFRGRTFSLGSERST
jgi:hypothetical protein